MEGDVVAITRLREHVQKRLRAGWGIKTVAAHLGLTVDDVFRYAGDALIGLSGMASRLRRASRVGHGLTNQT